MIILSPCCWQNAIRSGTRAIVPSSFMISQTTPAGFRPASRARSTAASVWPARWSTPPAPRAQREDVAGLDEVAAALARVDRDLDRARAVMGGDPGRDALARLDRDVKAVPNGVSLPVGHLRAGQLVAALLCQAEADEPAAVRGHEVEASGVANWAAIVRSPSFSRSVASTTTTNLPCADVLEGVLDASRTRRRLRPSRTNRNAHASQAPRRPPRPRA